VRKVLQLAEEEGAANTLRVGVRGGGCSGLSYFMDFDATPRDGDVVVEYGELKVVCDPKSMKLMAGTELDYETNLLKRGFKFNNPQAKRSCSCGESFAV
jgi:iron-sulfur cluster assembly protein